MMAFRAALIGCGMMGSAYADDPRIKGVSTHAGAYTACPDTTLVAVCDSDAERVERCGERWQVPARYQDYRVMLEEAAPGMVSICTPDSTHAEILGRVLATPGVKAVLAEKPLALDPAEGARLVNRAREAGVILAVNYSRRYAPNHQRMRELIAGGAIGTVRSIQGSYTRGCLHNGTHWFDLARFLVGEVVSVRGFDTLREGGPDPTLDALLTFGNGASGFLRACDHRSFSIFEADILGSAGRIRILESGHRIEISTVGDSPHYTGYRSLVVRETGTDGFGDLPLFAVRDLVRCLREGGEPLCTGEDALAALRIGHAIRRSSREGRQVRVPGGGHG